MRSDWFDLPDDELTARLTNRLDDQELVTALVRNRDYEKAAKRIDQAFDDPF